MDKGVFGNCYDVSAGICVDGKNTGYYCLRKNVCGYNGKMVIRGALPKLIEMTFLHIQPFRFAGLSERNGLIYLKADSDLMASYQERVPITLGRAIVTSYGRDYLTADTIRLPFIVHQPNSKRLFGDLNENDDGAWVNVYEYDKTWEPYRTGDIDKACIDWLSSAYVDTITGW